MRWIPPFQGGGGYYELQCIHNTSCTRTKISIKLLATTQCNLTLSYQIEYTSASCDSGDGIHSTQNRLTISKAMSNGQGVGFGNRIPERLSRKYIQMDTLKGNTICVEYLPHYGNEWNLGSRGWMGGRHQPSSPQPSDFQPSGKSASPPPLFESCRLRP